MSGRYEFGFAWGGPYGKAVRLVQRLASPKGLVIDLGAGYGAPGEVLADLGYEYIAIDQDLEALGNVDSRGFPAHEIDLNEDERLEERLLEIADGRQVAALLLLDTLEHLERPHSFLVALGSAATALGHPVMVLSVPNVAHFDVGVKLLLGTWDVTESGLLDSTHLHFYAEAGLTSQLFQAGWSEVGRDDYYLWESDQYRPEFPGLVMETPLREFLWRVRNNSDSFGTVNQFVRAYGWLDSNTQHLSTDKNLEDGPFLTAIVRSTGGRLENLKEALTCLAAQTSADFEVLLMVHSSLSGTVHSVQLLMDRFHPSFSSRVRVLQVVDGDRARPLNHALDEARGRFIAFLDDDDLVTAHWVETFWRLAQAQPGRVVRTQSYEVRARRRHENELEAPYVTLSRPSPIHDQPFDLVSHVHSNRTPICSFAVPMALVRSLHLGFDEGLPVVEDWDFLLRAAEFAGVVDSIEITSLYHSWERYEGSKASVDHRKWDAAREMVLSRLDQGPLLLPAGSASRIARIQEELILTKERADEAHKRVKQLEESELYRATAPIRWLLDFLRRRR